MPTKIEKDDVTGVMTTGHEWDGVKELNNPLPSWWLWMFYACILFAIVYAVLYPAIPTGGSYTKGLLGHSDRLAVADDLTAAKAAQSTYLTRIGETQLAAIRDDADLLNFSLAGGRAVFADNCAGCHGSGATGGPGYPSLQDDDWIWGGSIEAIHQTITHGIRWEADNDSRFSEMPRFGADGILTAPQISQVANYVLSLSGAPHNAAEAQEGEQLFVDNCVACHGEKGAGNQELGAPRLSDQIWLFGGSKEAVMAQINAPHQGVMPAWTGRLDEATIKMLAVYVHSLGGGQASN